MRALRIFQGDRYVTPFRARKAIYYISRGVGIYLPQSMFQKLRNKHSSHLPADNARIAERVDYYNKLDGRVPLTRNVSDLRSLRKGRRTTYFYDFYEFARYFEPDRKFYYEFGDITEIPTQPAFVKSRPIEGDNRNAVLLKLDKIRHFSFVSDPTPTSRKKDAVVWRGYTIDGQRLQFVERYAGKPGFDVGRVNVPSQRPELWRPFLPVAKQLQYKFIFSIEGVDVASNLKWIMASNSVCMMKKPKFETWFMEGRLVPGVHYIPIKDDFSDVEEKMEYYLGHPREMMEIIQNANRYIAQFKDSAVERQVSLLVIEKYFKHTAAD